MESSISVAPQLAANLDGRGYKTLTPIQKAVLTKDLTGKDALVSAQTGSGKTVAFGLAISENILNKKVANRSKLLPSALIIAPTRELALQVKNELLWLYAGTSVAIASCVGGMDMRAEKRDLNKNPEIILGTPGRLKDYLERGFLKLSAINVVVLDEADEMLNLGFREELEAILQSTPKARRTLLFSATISKGIERLAARYQREALRISTITQNEPHMDIEYQAITVANRDTEHAIMNVLRYHEATTALVFCGTRANVNHLTSRLNNRGFSVVSLSGELSQKERLSALQSMRNGQSKVCVATDVAARGIDLPNLDLVIHADLPRTKESLLHRSGRTGRAGNKGISVLIVPLEARKRIQRLLENSQIQSTWLHPPGREEILKRDNDRLLQDMAVGEPPTKEEQNLVSLLVKKYTAENIAYALIRSFKSDKFSPDDIQEIDEQPLKRVKRDHFKNSMWLKLSVGRSHKTDPGWLLSKLTRVGHINKRDIGSIKIGEKESFVEINPTTLDKLLHHLEKNDEVQSGLKVVLLDKAPKLFSRGRTSSEFTNSKQRRKIRRAKDREDISKNDPQSLKRNKKNQKIPKSKKS